MQARYFYVNYSGKLLFLPGCYFCDS
uniref:Uncharacterized protein n=1 Tax=Rhizophora mucronata TaxID=61149 RepID=A0A2P2NNI9_RHIMU